MKPNLDLVALHFEKALGISAEERERYLSSLQNEELAEEVRSLMRFTKPQTDLLEKSITLQVPHEIPDFAHGEKVGHFMVLKKVGEGSFGKVFLAHDTKLEREVALKVTPLVGNEAQAMAHLDHQNIVKVFSEETVIEKNIRVICMQYIRGKTLCEKPSGELKGYKGIIRIISELCKAMELAHEKGVLHLDIKPENILIDEKGKSYLTDFNISRLGHVQGGIFGGTVDYMSPEQSAALYSGNVEAFEQLGKTADVYSMGIVFKQMMESQKEDTIPSEIKIAINFIVENATLQNSEKRTSDFTELSAQIDDLITYDRALQKLPRETALDKITRLFPRASLILTILLPQLFGSVVNITYNSMQIVSKLNTPQKEVFHTLLFVLNPIIYSVATLSIVYQFRSVFIFLVKKESTRKETLEKAIRLCISGPSYIAWVTTLGWGVSALLFPLLIHVLSPSLSPAIFYHFAVSFVLSWLIAMTYSYLNAQYFLVRKIYPSVWNISSLLHSNKLIDLNKIESRMRLFPFFAGAVPLVGSLLLIVVDYDKSFVISFNLMSMLGLGYALVATKKMHAILYCFK